MLRRRISDVLLGLALVAVGVVIAGNAMAFWHIELFFPGWWTLLILVPCLISIIRSGFHLGNVAGLLIGGVLLSDALFTEVHLRDLLVPMLLITIGLYIIFSHRKRREIARISDQNKDRQKPDFTCVFGERNYVCDGLFYGAQAQVVFGSACFDLRQADLQADAVIRLHVVFGGAQILAPDNVRIRQTGTRVFGGVDEKYRARSADGPVLMIQADCVFGGVEIL